VPHKSAAPWRETIRTRKDAVLAQRSVRIRYRTGRTGAVSSRTLDPYRVWYRSGGLYVVGHDHKSRELRTFAVDRITQIEATTRRFTVAADFDFERYIGSSFGVIAETPPRGRILFDSRWAGYIAERTWHPSQSLTPRERGRVELSMEVGGIDEMRHWILSLGDGVIVTRR